MVSVVDDRVNASRLWNDTVKEKVKY